MYFSNRSIVFSIASSYQIKKSMPKLQQFIYEQFFKKRIHWLRQTFMKYSGIKISVQLQKRLVQLKYLTQKIQKQRIKVQINQRLQKLTLSFLECTIKNINLFLTICLQISIYFSNLRYILSQYQKLYYKMGNICPCFFKKISKQRQSPYDVHETFEIDENVGSMQSGTNNNFQKLTEEPIHSANTINKQVNLKTQIKNTKNQSSVRGTQVPIRQYQEDLPQNMLISHQGSAKSLIRRHMHGSLNLNDCTDESLENLDRVKKVVTNIYNSQRQINIKGCKKSQIFIFDTSNSIKIQNCSESLIFCAPCAGKISIANCKQMKLIIVCSKMEIKNSKYCEVSLFCLYPTILIASSEICFSNFLRIGYYGMIDQISTCGFQVWNNKILEVQDLDKNPEEEHYSQKKLHAFQIQWQQILSQGGMQSADPIVPLFWGDFNVRKKKQIFVMNEPMRQVELRLLKHIISNNVTIHKSFKGILSNSAFSKMKQLFPYHEQNKYLCLMIGKQLQSSGFQAYFQRIVGKDVEQIQQSIFPSVEQQK